MDTEYLQMLYHILFIICGEKLLLFHVFTFIPEKNVCGFLPVFISFHSIHVQNLPKNFHSCEAIHEKQESVSLQIISNIWYFCDRPPAVGHGLESGQ